jgi:hypothetical protein
MKDAPYIPDEVLNHTAGDPRTYLTSLSQIKNYSNIEGNETVTSGNKTSTGTGVGFATQTIGEEDTKEKNYDVSLDYKATVKAGVGGVTVGASVGYGYSRSLGWSATNAKEFSGTVVSVPKDFSQYSFEWTLLTYNYLLPKEDGTYNKEAPRCMVVNYAVAPTFGDLPPRVPQNFQVDNGITVPGGVALKWDKVDGAGSYVVLKAISSNDKEPSEKDYVTVAAINDTTYVVDKIDLGTSYFKVFARSFTDKKGLPTEEAIKVNAKLPINLTIMQHPKNVYIEGEKLDLSSLVASIGYEGNITQDIEYKDFTTYGLSTSGLNDGQVLSSNHNNLVITVNHNAAKLTANINPLLIDIAGLYNLSANVVFRIGEKDNATQLKANEELVAAITTRNLKSEEQKIMVIVALYDEKGTMVKMVWEGRNVPAMGMETMKLGFKLPGMINGHVVKVMLWDGNNFNSTIQSPQSGTVQLMAP